MIISEEGDDPPEGLDSLNILEKNELISEPDLIPPLVEIGSLESENHESEVSHAAPIDVIVSSDALPPVNTGRKLESVESANLRLYVESLVSNFLVESMKEYMKTNQPPPSISPRKNIQQQQQHVPQYIHEMLHSVLQNYLMKIAESSDPLSAHDVEDTSQPLSPTELTNDATASPPLATSPPEEVSDQRPESTQLLSEITKSYEEKIAIYEQKILELQSSYDELQRSTSETISNQASQLVDLNEKLEEKSTELKALHTHHNDMLSNELMLRREMDERISMIDEELQSVVHTWKLSSALSDLKIQEISEQLKYTQDDLSETIEYYRVRLEDLIS